MRNRLALALLTALALGGCGGGSAGSGTPSGGLSTQSNSEQSIAATNALGSPLKHFTEINNTVSALADGRRTLSVPLGTCQNGTEFFAPDKTGDPNSTEAQYFYDSACSQIARDVVRLYASTGAGSETVNRTMKLFAVGNGTPSAVRTDAVVITNAQFDQYGFPKAATGFDRTAQGELDLAGVKTIVSGDELVMLPGTGGSTAFCSDSAGFNATGVPALGETFGWQGGVLSGGLRTVNNDGTVTFSANHAGSTFKAPIGSLSIAIATQNGACPIVTPMFTLAGGTQVSTYSFPITATFQAGLLLNLSIQNGKLANGDGLSVATNAGVSPTSNLFITGTVTDTARNQIATFNVDAFGDGTLTVTGSGRQFVITDWHVIR